MTGILMGWRGFFLWRGDDRGVGYVVGVLCLVGGYIVVFFFLSEFKFYGC